MNIELWQQPHVEKVLRYHNQKHGSSYALIGPCETVYPGLAGHKRWDWVCEDTNTGARGAIEVKRLTDQDKHRESSVLEQLGTYLENVVSPSLDGIYSLNLFTGDQPIDIGRANIDTLKEGLIQTISDIYPKLNVDDSLDITNLVKQSTSVCLPSDFYIELKNLKAGDRRLVVELFTGGMAPTVQLTGNNLSSFSRIVNSANEQLAEAKGMGLCETFLLFLDLLYHLAAPVEAIEKTINQLPQADLCNIDYVYHLSNKVSQIM